MEPENSNNRSETIRIAEGYVRGVNGWQKTLGRNYKIEISEISTSSSNVVRIIDKTSNVDQIANALKDLQKVQKAQLKYPAKAAEFAAKISKAQEHLSAVKAAAPKGSAVVRLDGPHRGTPYNFDHININPGISGRPDPHIPLPTGGLEAGTGAAKCAKILGQVNKVAVPVAIAVNTVQVGCSMYQDYQHGSTRNTVETATDLVGGWGGGYGGALAGATVGSAIFPGIGTIVGGVVGAISGGIGGSKIANIVGNTISDTMGYDMIEIKCTACGKTFICRIYCEEKRKYCEKCRRLDKK